MCNNCMHLDVCKYIEKYKEQLELIDVSKLNSENIVVFARCKRYKDKNHGIYIVEPNILYGSYTGEY